MLFSEMRNSTPSFSTSRWWRTEPDGVEVILENAGIALPVYINLAISGADRVVREVRLALRRHREERLVAMRSAATLLRTELRGAVAGILLSTELAMKNPSMPIEARSKDSVCLRASGRDQDSTGNDPKSSICAAGV